MACDHCAMNSSTDVRTAAVAQIDPITLYRLLALRVDVFVVEQHCAYRELDGRDIEPDALMIWIEQDGRPVATLRLLTDPDGRARIGRVATDPGARSAGLAARLMRRALELASDRDIVLDAQAQLQGWYERFGFARSGDPFDEDGISHVPMTRPAAATVGKST
jgi:ElaA protein